MSYFVYILASKPKGTLYIGVTNNLVRRIHEHKSQWCDVFAARYDVHHLVWSGLKSQNPLKRPFSGKNSLKTVNVTGRWR